MFSGLCKKVCCRCIVLWVVCVWGGGWCGGGGSMVFGCGGGGGGVLSSGMVVFCLWGWFG